MPDLVQGSAPPEEIARDWEQFTGGPPVVGVLRRYQPEDVESLALRDGEGRMAGLVTWWVQGDRAEIVSLHAATPGQGTGTALMDAAEAALRRRGVRQAVLVTSNDNLAALRFYVRRGYRLVRVHLDAMDAVRALKPAVPLTGRDGAPLRDLWELWKDL
ncbi:MAG TPA: GNAT family N-acetyltransferase [Dehalococcoidia bacterium]